MTTATSTLLFDLLNRAANTATPNFLGENLGADWVTLCALPDGTLRVDAKLTPDTDADGEGYFYGLSVRMTTHREYNLFFDSIWGIEEPAVDDAAGWQAFEQHLSHLCREMLLQMNRPDLVRKLLSYEAEQLQQLISAI